MPPAIPMARWLLWARMLLAAALGAVTGLGLAPYGLWPVALIGWMILPALIVVSETPMRAAWTGWAFAAGFFANGLTWIVEPFMVDAARDGWMAPFALVFMSGGLALFWAAAFYGAHRLGRGRVNRCLVLVPCLALAEFGRAYLLTGFPWAAPAQALIESPALPLLAWLGPQGLGLLALAASIGTGLFALRRRVVFLAPVALFAVLSVAAQITRPAVTMTDHIVRLIQPNAVQKQKWDPEWIPVYFQRQLDFTAEGARPDLIVWPESAIAPVYEQSGPWLDAVTDAAGGSQVALGIRRYDGRLYNALIRMDGDGTVTDIYDKHHLVPFGEYIPLGGLAKRFGIHGLAAEDGDGYSSGPGPVLVDFGPLGKALPLICYEAVFPQDVNGAPGRADFLLQITNDAWFGKRVGPYQHLAQARMRAVEQGLPMLRAANTGISAVIDPDGRVLDSLGLGRAGYIDATLPAPLSPTIYARTGDLPWLVLVVLMLIACLAVPFRQSTRESD
ncbi:Apolipoprotein N-acyltransferase [Marinibacterium anthonyi]|nr:Apolipoprotein N-acyltransferase [Marinibacterium anthonyi]